MGLPKLTQTIFPKAMARISSGWQMNTLPDNSVAHVSPRPELLSHGIITQPVSHTSDGN